MPTTMVNLYQKLARRNDLIPEAKPVSIRDSFIWFGIELILKCKHASDHGYTMPA